jgi:peptidoglycan hydrolase-like protein with peptidoglycan-binding domain
MQPRGDQRQIASLWTDNQAIQNIGEIRMAWRLARGLEKLRAQVNAKWPSRSKQSDGSIGDEAHASRGSDHNPWVKDGAMGVVTAIDITHDPDDGFDSYAFADMLLKNRDARIKNVISNGRIGAGSEGPSPWAWRKYSGSNKHDHHVHISVKSNKSFYDDASDWKIDGMAAPVVAGYVKPNPTLRRGSKGDLVELLQSRLKLTVDGIFGPATEAAVKAMQAGYNIAADGIVGPQTWEKLK